MTTTSKYVEGIEKQNEELREKLVAAETKLAHAMGCIDAINFNTKSIMQDYESMKFQHAAMKESYEKACALVAQMHAAAVGEIRGPISGVVEDVKNLKDNYDRLHDKLRY